MVACVSPLFLFMVESYFTMWRDHILFIHSSVDGHWGCFHFLAIMNSVAKNIRVQFSVWTYILNSFGCMPKSEIAGHMVTLCLTF